MSALLRAISSLRVEIDRSPQFEGWLILQRRRLNRFRIGLLERLAGSLSRPESDEVLAPRKLDRTRAPFDQRAHETSTTLERRGQLAACSEHLAATARHFEAEDRNFAHADPPGLAAHQGRARRQDVSGYPLFFRHCVGRRWAFLETAAASNRRSSLAVMPFLEESERRGGLAGSLTHDIITRLAKLRACSSLREVRSSPSLNGTRRLKKPAAGSTSIMSPAAWSIHTKAALS